MKKLFYACASLLCLALGASALILSGSGALRLLDSRAEQAQKQTQERGISTDMPVQPVSNPAEPATPPADHPAQAAVSSDTAPAFRVYVWNPDQVMKNTQPGRTVSKFAEAYQKVMDQNIKALNAAIADKKKRYDKAQAQKLIADFAKRKTTVENDARRLIRNMVRQTMRNSPKKDALLIENDRATYVPNGVNITEELIRAIDPLKLDLPDPPKPIVIK